MKIKNFYFDPDREAEDAYNASASFAARMFLPVTNDTPKVENDNIEENYEEDEDD